MNVPAFSPVETKTAPEMIYTQIYQKIVDGSLKPGDRLPSERVLSEQFQRSRHIIREAIRMLQQDGLVRVEVGSNGGTIIQGISMEMIEKPLKKYLFSGALELEELIEYRYLNEYNCVKLAATRRSEEDIQAMESILESAKQHIEDPENFYQHDIDFHIALAAASHNRLAMVVNHTIVGLNTEAILEATKTYSREEQIALNRRVYETHYAIFEAIRSRDPIAAEYGVEQMITLFHEQFQKHA